MGVDQDKERRQNKAFLILSYHLLCLGWSCFFFFFFFFVTIEGLHDRWEEGTRLFGQRKKTASMSCSFTIDASAGFR